MTPLCSKDKLGITMIPSGRWVEIIDIFVVSGMLDSN
jgi:hypothetical protein